MKLYGFFRSGTSHRLRIALNLKGLSYEQVAIDLRKELRRRCVLEERGFDELLDTLGFAFMGACR